MNLSISFSYPLTQKVFKEDKVNVNKWGFVNPTYSMIFIFEKG